MPSVNEAILDAQISHQIGLGRYSVGVIQRIIKLLSKVEADLVGQILKFDPNEVSGAWSQKRLEKLLAAIRTINKEAYQAISRELTSEMKAFGSYEAEFQSRTLVKLLPVQFDIVTPSSAQVYAATMARPFQGMLLKEVFDGLEPAAFARVRNAVRMGFVEGETTDQIIRRIRGRRANNYADGLTEISRKDAEKVVRTAVAHTAAVAREETYEQNANLVKGIRWTSTLDGRTTQTCIVRDGLEYTTAGKPVGHSVPWNGGPGRIHWQCRSTSVPVTKSWRELGFDVDELPPSTRASMDGQVPGKTTYFDFLKSKPAAFQDSVLGKTKGALLRRGELPVEKFFDRSGKAYTLDELRTREARAWEKAGL